MKLKVFVRKTHKWLSLIVGTQILIWTASGFFMSFVPIDKIRSEHLVSKPENLIIKPTDRFAPVHQILEKENIRKATEVRLKTFHKKFVYEIKDDSNIGLYDAFSGKKLDPISRDTALHIANAHYAGSDKATSVKLIEKPIVEYRGKLPVWKVDFENGEGTSFYVSPETGKLTARRSTLWRIYDFMWMLHIMDYDERENFNNWWLVVASIFAVATSLSGILLLFYSFRKLDFNLRH
jgi:uncharacterized protein YpmB